MKETVNRILRKLLSREVIIYIVFGVLTTVVNFIAFYLFNDLMHIHYLWANALAWVVAVAFAFLTNKPFVFKSHDWSLKTVVPELTKFLGCRIGSGVMETVIIFLAVDLLRFDGNVMKLFTSVLVVIVNYVGSKLLVFTKK